MNFALMKNDIFKEKKMSKIFVKIELPPSYEVSRPDKQDFSFLSEMKYTGGKRRLSLNLFFYKKVHGFC